MIDSFKIYPLNCTKVRIFSQQRVYRLYNFIGFVDFLIA